MYSFSRRQQQNIICTFYGIAVFFHLSWVSLTAFVYHHIMKYALGTKNASFLFIMHVACNAIYYITDVEAKYSGSCHDSFLLRQSAIAMHSFSKLGMFDIWVSDPNIVLYCVLMGQNKTSGLKNLTWGKFDPEPEMNSIVRIYLYQLGFSYF